MAVNILGGRRMGKSFDFDEQKRKAERGMTNAEFIAGAGAVFEDYETIIMIGLAKDGSITTYHTTGNGLEAVGLLEVSKAQLLAEMRE